MYRDYDESDDLMEWNDELEAALSYDEVPTRSSRHRTEVECVECGNPMWLEGYIGDDIPLCHACYSNESLEKYGYDDEDSDHDTGDDDAY